MDGTTDIVQLPPIVVRYLAAHRDHDADAAVAAFAEDATVVDGDGKIQHLVIAP